MALVRKCESVAHDLQAVAHMIAGKEDIPLMINPTLLQSKVAIWQQKVSHGRELLKRAREIALKTLWPDDAENYLSFLFDYIMISFMFSTEQYEFETLLKVHDEMTEIKAKIDARGSIFEANVIDQKDVPF